MLNSWMFYVILGLSASTAALGWLSLSLHDDKVIAVEALRLTKESVSILENSLDLKDKSCQIDNTSVVELELEKKQIDDVISPINSQLKELATVKKSSPSIKVVNTKQEINKDEKSSLESDYLPDDGFLSPNVKRLLNNGWCSVYPSTSQCVPTRQPAG